MTQTFFVETSGGAPGYVEYTELDDYEEATRYLDELAADREAKGWTVERGLVSRDNLVAVRCTSEADGRGPDGEYLSDRYPRTIAIQVVYGR